MTKEQMTERLTKLQQDRQTLAANIDQAVARLHAMEGQIQLLTELTQVETPKVEVPKEE